MPKEQNKSNKKFLQNKITQTLPTIIIHRTLKTERKINCKLRAQHMLKKTHKTVRDLSKDPSRLAYKMMRTL